MSDQKYESKSFIISLGLHEGSSRYLYKAKEYAKFRQSIIYPLFTNGLYFLNGDSSDNKSESSTKISFENVKWFDVRIVIHSHKDFSIGQVSTENDAASFAQHFFSNTPGQGLQLDKYDEYIPIVHITLDNTYVENLYSNNKKLPKQISRSFQIIDSSIWNKIVPFDRCIIDNFDIGGSTGLYKVIKQIDKYYQRGLFHLDVAHEYANLNARLTKQAFLSGSHASGVSPFIFHSESAIEQMINKEFKDGGKESIKEIDNIANLNWRFLLIDDKAQNKLSSPKGMVDMGVSKLDVLISLLEELFPNNIIESKPYKPQNNISVVGAKNEEVTNAEKARILIEFVETKKDAKEAIKDKEKQYDVILLDYLLDKDNDVEYGYELLNEIYKEIDGTKDSYGNYDYEQTGYVIGPHGQLFFMFISAYSTAVYERLLAEGLNRSEDFWYIGEGACPTNTPELFKYRLLHLMKRRLGQTGISDLTEKNIVKTIKDIFSVQDKDKVETRIKDVRKRAYKNYHKVLGYHYDYSILRENDRGKSVLVDSFLEKQVHLGAMLEHLLQMVHLIAFGTVRQWPEIWEEYMFLTRTVNSERDSLPEISKLIEDYIITLKTM